MKDHKGYEIKTKMDWQDVVVLLVCILAALFLAALLGVSP